METNELDKLVLSVLLANHKKHWQRRLHEERASLAITRKAHLRKKIKRRIEYLEMLIKQG